MRLRVSNYFNLFAAGLIGGVAGQSFGNGHAVAGAACTLAAGINLLLAFRNRPNYAELMAPEEKPAVADDPSLD